MAADPLPDRRLQAARLIGRVFHPLVQVPVLLAVVAAQAAGARGVGLGLLAAGIAAGVPAVAVWLLVRAGRLDDLDLSRRQQRPPVLALALPCVVIALVLLLRLDAPTPLLRLLVAIVAALAVAAVTSLVWKGSLHTATTVGIAIALGVAVHPVLGLAYSPAVVLVGWARVRTRSHTVAQVVAGALVGAAVSTALVFLLEGW